MTEAQWERAVVAFEEIARQTKRIADLDEEENKRRVATDKTMAQLMGASVVMQKQIIDGGPR